MHCLLVALIFGVVFRIKVDAKYQDGGLFEVVVCKRHQFGFTCYHFFSHYANSAHNGDLPHGQNLTLLVDHGFGRLDHSPKDGQVTIAEFNELIDLDDRNNDSCVDYNEFSNQMTEDIFVDVSQRMYLHFDPDGDNCLDVTEMGEEFHKIDKDADGVVDKHEFEHYYTNLLKHLYQHSHGK